ncbi:hypothetical protein [Paraburkholderia atlantica]|uniref:hypothetical protein n=1 Tax=Paraburkholderia atlantica TaxID=2654982 RepID=UPI001611F870|nr:hypothetical protein [Paraburkholderia atlantica]MBB5508109.1 hypothetical protein [Paraburkholderia atlantica]
MSLDVYLNDAEKGCVYSANITHNLGAMAREAGIYQHLWRPEELGITRAKELIDPVYGGLTDMIQRPSHYEQFNAANGWGLYENFVANPDATIEVWR